MVPHFRKPLYVSIYNKYTCVCVYTYIYIYIYTHTYICVHTTWVVDQKYLFQSPYEFCMSVLIRTLLTTTIITVIAITTTIIRTTTIIVVSQNPKPC